MTDRPSSHSSLTWAVVGLVSALGLAAAFHVSAQGQAPAPAGGRTPPKLVVLFVVDQFRADYVSTYGAQWTGGLREIFTKGAHFTEAAYPYAYTVTCVGHSTIGTGTLPSTHGMIGNEWFDPKTREYTTCTEDASAQSMAYAGATGTEHHSAKWLLVPTFADELKRQAAQPVRVVSISGKARSSIGLGGHGGPNSILVWEEDGDGRWATSSAVARRLSPEVDAYVKAHPILGMRGVAWGRALPESAYLFNDKAAGEPTASTFPHLIKAPIKTSRTSATYTEMWDRTPLVDEYLANLGQTLVDKLQLGRQAGTDMLAISFSGLDIAGHTYGPQSHEVQDTLARLDKILGQVIGMLDKTVGRDKYVLALSADHGVASLPEQAEPSANAGRLDNLLPVGNAIEAVLEKAFGPGNYVEAIAAQYLYLYPGILDRVRADASLVKAVETAALSVRGMASVYWSADIAATTPVDDPVLAKLRKGYVAGRSGDLAVVQRPNWIVGATGANHGTPYDYDARVPVLLFGAGIMPGRYATAATPVDIAPTLAALTNIRLAKTDGRVLTEALAKQ